MKFDQLFPKLKPYTRVYVWKNKEQTANGLLDEFFTDNGYLPQVERDLFGRCRVLSVDLGPRGDHIVVNLLEARK